MSELSEPASFTTLRQLPNVAYLASSVLLGIWFSSVVPLPLWTEAFVICIWTGASVYWRRQRSMRLALVCFCVAGFCIGMTRYTTWVSLPQGPQLREFCRVGAMEVTIQGKISSIPVAHRKHESVYSPRLYGPPHQTRFTLTVDQVCVNEITTNVAGNCRVYVQGRGAETLSCGDVVSVYGRLDWPLPPGNPGEFDFGQFLIQQNIAGMLFVDRLNDITVLRPANPLAPQRLLGILRNEAYRILAANVTPDMRGIAMALLLGSRHELPPEISRSFIASGTMHLLAISGLHVGVLCLFILRIQHLLMVRRSIALLSTLLLCITYAFMTDLRPSVLRATIFFMVFVIGELVNRQQRMPALLSLTGLLMMLYQPGMIFEIGSWLSFLSVAALGWESSRQNTNAVNREAPQDGSTFAEKARRWSVIFGRRLRLRYRQMLYILVFTTPLITSTFHVLSPVGLIVNIALIPLTGIALCVGFLTLAFGLLLPSTAIVPGLCFSGLLSGLVAVVTGTASIDRGHFFVADFPEWFVPVYYVILLVALILRTAIWQRIAFGILLGSWFAVLLLPLERKTSSGIECTFLDVGHGNAAVIECANGDAYLVDAGARNRSERTADIVCRFLWKRGHERLAGVIISRPDVNHFNGLPGILARVPVARIMVSSEFYKIDNRATRALRDLLKAHQTDVKVVSTGDEIPLGSATLTIHQRTDEPRDIKTENDERSLDVIIKHDTDQILLPANREASDAKDLFQKTGPVTVLVAAGHGSKRANTQLVADALQPQCVIVSSADDANRLYLENIYASSKTVKFTGSSGAISIKLKDGHPPMITSHR